MSAEYDDYTGGQADAGAEGGGAYEVDQEGYGVGPYDEPADEDLAARVAAVEEQQLDARRYEDAERLVQAYPQLAQPEQAQALVREAREAAEFLGRPELGDEPRFWGLIADQRAAAAGGGSRGGPSEDPRIDMILNGGRPGLGARCLDFDDSGPSQARGASGSLGARVLDFD